MLNFGTGANDSSRVETFISIINAINPDILCVQEINNEEGLRFFDEVVKKGFLPNWYVFRTPWLEQPGLDVAVWFMAERVDTYGLEYINTTPRHIAVHTMTHKGTRDTIHIYVGHFKAGQDVTDEEQRLATARAIRAHSANLPLHHDYILAGDLNVYTADETAYRQLINADDIGGKFIDPINRPGDWHNNRDFADIHTQSPRARQFEGGAHGGMDDRFDQILISPSLMDNYVPGSYTTFGNDGNHFNDSINAMPNTAVSQEIAQALHDASDHLPVYLELVFEKNTVSVEDEQEWVDRLLDLW